MLISRHHSHAIARARLIALVVLVSTSVAWLWDLRHATWAEVELHRPLEWFVTTPTDAVMAVARLLAMATAGWWLATTVLYAAAAVADAGSGPIRRLAQLAPSAARRMVDAAMTATLAGAVTAAAVPLAPTMAMAAEAETQAPLPPFLPQAPATGDPRPRVVAPEVAPEVMPTIPAPVVADPGTPPAAAGPREVTVAPGDSLWRIAARAVADDDMAAVAPLWRRTVEVNHDRLRSGDPDLIFPGETIVLPAEVVGEDAP